MKVVNVVCGVVKCTGKQGQSFGDGRSSAIMLAKHFKGDWVWLLRDPGVYDGYWRVAYGTVLYWFVLNTNLELEPNVCWSSNG
jgi:hypothetical protein